MHVEASLATVVRNTVACVLIHALLLTTLPASAAALPFAPAGQAGATPAPTAGQQITLAANGAPIAAADVALVLANMNKVSLGATDSQGKTTAPLDLANAAPGNPALNLANLGKVELHAEVDQCANGKQQVYLVGPGGQLPPPPANCKRQRLAGTFYWGATTAVVLDTILNSLVASGGPMLTGAAARPAAGTAAQPNRTATGTGNSTNTPANTTGGTPGTAQTGTTGTAATANGANTTGVTGTGGQTGSTPTNTTGGGQTGTIPANTTGGARPGAAPAGNTIGTDRPATGANTTAGARPSVPMPPGAVPLPDEATHAINQAMEKYLTGLTQNVSGDVDPSGTHRGLIDKQALVLVQDVYLRDLGKYAVSMSEMAALPDAQLDQLTGQLRKDAAGVYGAYSMLMSAERAFNPLQVGQSMGDMKSGYESLMREADTAEKNGDPAFAAGRRELANSTYGAWPWYLQKRQEFYAALDKNPLLGIQIKGYISDGDYLFKVLQTQTDAFASNASLRQLIRDHLNASREQTNAEIDRAAKLQSLVELWQFGQVKYQRQQDQAAALGPFAKSLIDTMLAVHMGYNAEKAVDDGLKNLGLTVLVAAVSLVPVVGPLASAGIQLYHDGSDLVIAYVDNLNVQNAAGAIGYTQRIASADALADAQFRTLVAAAMFLPTVPGALSDLRAAGIKIVRRASPATQATVAEEAAIAAGTKPALVKTAPEVPGMAPGRQAATDAEAQQMLKDFLARQDRIGGVDEVTAEIDAARKAGVPEDTIQSLTRNFSETGLPVQNKAIASDLLKARLEKLGYDLNMTAEEFNQLQGLSVRNSAKGAGLTEADYKFMREKLAADPQYFDKLPQRGYLTDFNQDPFHGRFQPQEGFIGALDAESAANLKKALVAWDKSLENSSQLRQFEQIVQSSGTPDQVRDLAMALKADPQAMRSLKNAPSEVKDAFNWAEKTLVYDVHDAAVMDYVKTVAKDHQGNPAPWSQPGVELQVDDFRTPGGNGVGVNTDRDFRVLYKNANGEWLEVPKEYWQNYSTEQFAKASGYTPAKLREIAAPDDVTAWNNWDPAKHNGESVEQAMEDKWKELHQQLGTDKGHPEASVEFSDQGTRNGYQAQVAQNIKDVKAGNAMLKDPEGFGIMYNEKADVYLRMKSALHPDGDKLEAMAQLNKGIDMLGDVRDGYTRYFQKYGQKPPFQPVPPRLEAGAKLIKSLGPFNKTITAKQIQDVEDGLRALGYGGPSGADPLRGFVKDLDGQFEALKTVNPPMSVPGFGAPAVTNTAAGKAAAVAAPATNSVIGTGIRAGDRVALDRIVRVKLTSAGQNAATWKAVTAPGGYVFYTSPDGKSTVRATFTGGGVVLQTTPDTPAMAGIGGPSAPPASNPVPGGTAQETPPPAACASETHDCAAAQQALNEAADAYDSAKSVFDAANADSQSTATAMNNAAKALAQAQAATKLQSDPAVAAVQSSLDIAKQADDAATAALKTADAALQAATEKVKQAKAALDACQQKAAPNCPPPAASNTAQNPATNTTGATPLTGGSATPAPVPGGNTVGGTTAPGPPIALVCKNSNDDCAELGRLASQARTAELQAQYNLEHVSDLIRKADWLHQDAISLHNQADRAFSLMAATSKSDPAASAQYKAEAVKLNAQGDDKESQSQTIRAQANGAQAAYDAAKAAADAAFKAFHDCLALPPCPPAATGQTATGLTTGGVDTGANTTGGAATGGFSNCPEAQSALDSANFQHGQAAKYAGLAQQALARGDGATAQSDFLDAASAEAAAQRWEALAAYDLQKCHETAVAGQPPAATGTGVVSATPATGTTRPVTTPGVPGVYGTGIRGGDYVSMDGLVHEILNQAGQNGAGWKSTPMPGGSVIYVSPDGKTSVRASFTPGGSILIETTPGTPAMPGIPAGAPPATSTPVPGGTAQGTPPPSPCPEATNDCAALQQAYNEALDAYDAAKSAFDEANTAATATADATNTADSKLQQAIAAAKQPNDPAVAAAQGSLNIAKQADDAAAAALKAANAALEAAIEKRKQAQTALEACEQKAAPKCPPPAASSTAQNPGGNTVGATPGGATTGGAVQPGGAGGTPAPAPGGNTVGAVPGGTPAPAAPLTCKNSNDDCAALGRLASQAQTAELQAQDTLNHVPDMQRQADWLHQDAINLHNQADHALDLSTGYARNKLDPALAQQYMTEFEALQKAGDAKEAESQALRAKANGAQAAYDAAKAAAAAAFKAFHDCLSLPPCPHSATGLTATGTNTTGGVTTGGNTTGGNTTGGTATGGFSDCPAAQSALDEANFLHGQAAKDVGLGQQALIQGNAASAQSWFLNAAMDESSAQRWEELAAYNLQKCHETPTPANATGTGVTPGTSTTGTPTTGTTPTPAPAPATTPATATTGGTVTEIPQPTENVAACAASDPTCAKTTECTGSSCMTVADLCKAAACAVSNFIQSLYQTMMLSAPIAGAQGTASTPRRSNFSNAMYRGPSARMLPIAAGLTLPELAAPAFAAAQGTQAVTPDVSIVSTGNSSGEAFQLQMRDPSGQTKTASLPEGTVLVPTNPGSEKPAASRGTAGLLTQQMTGFCLQFAKLPPAVGMVYKIASPAMQQNFAPLKQILQAGRVLAQKGKLHPDSEPNAYADSIRQYAVWSKQEGWDQQKFGDEFVDRTRKNAEARNVKWTPVIEQALRSAVPGRWADITQVLNLAQSWQKAQPQPQR